MMNAVTAGSILCSLYPGHPELHEWLSLPDDYRTLDEALRSAECIVESIDNAGPLGVERVDARQLPAIVRVLADYTRRHTGKEGHKHS